MSAVGPQESAGVSGAGRGVVEARCLWLSERSVDVSGGSGFSGLGQNLITLGMPTPCHLDLSSPLPPCPPLRSPEAWRRATLLLHFPSPRLSPLRLQVSVGRSCTFRAHLPRLKDFAPGPYQAARGPPSPSTRARTNSRLTSSAMIAQRAGQR